MNYTFISMYILCRTSDVNFTLIPFFIKTDSTSYTLRSSDDMTVFGRIVGQSMAFLYDTEDSDTTSLRSQNISQPWQSVHSSLQRPPSFFITFPYRYEGT